MIPKLKVATEIHHREKWQNWIFYMFDRFTKNSIKLQTEVLQTLTLCVCLLGRKTSSRSSFVLVTVVPPEWYLVKPILKTVLQKETYNCVQEKYLIEFFPKQVISYQILVSSCQYNLHIFLATFISIWFNSTYKKLLCLSIWFWKIKIICILPCHIQIHLVSENYHITMVNFPKGKVSKYFQAREVILACEYPPNIIKSIWT